MKTLHKLKKINGYIHHTIRILKSGFHAFVVIAIGFH
jgi:hypothetical protein